MYIESVKAENFGRLGSCQQEYVDGLIVVRGGNGSGKTTMTTQVPLYAFFGTSTLDSPMEDTVKEGCKPTSMKVEVKYGPYITKRSKASASVTGPGVDRTGQAEVTEFWYDFFGISKGTEEASLYAKQNETAGILEGKAGEVTSVIEALAGFDQIDGLIERIKVKFPSGNKAILTENLETEKESLVTLNEKVLPDVKLALQEEKALENQVKVFDKEITGWQLKVDGFKEKFLAALETNNKIDAAENNVAVEQAKIDQVKTRIEELGKIVRPVFNDKEIKRAEMLLSTVEQRRKAWDAYQWVVGLVEPDNVWDGPVEEFQEELSTSAKKVAAVEKDIAAVNYKKSGHEAQIIPEGEDKCPTCGSVTVKDKDKINSRLEGLIKDFDAVLADRYEALTEAKEYLEILNDINNEHLRRIKIDRSEFLEVLEDTIPYTFKFKGDIPVKPEEGEIVQASDLLAECKRVLAAIERDNEEINNLKFKWTDLTISKTVLVAARETLGKVIPTADITKGVEISTEGLGTSLNQKIVVEGYLKAATEKRITAEKDIEVHERDLSLKKIVIKSLKDKLKADAYNSQLLKSVRDAKPKVLDLVWSNVTKLVTHKSSEMMGREMVLDKGPKGFRVNGRHVGRLSGAESSSVGIALRESIRDIFAPNAGFMMLDEPAASMDDDVKNATVSAITSMSGQVFVITHESDLEIFADQMVEMSREEG